MARVHVVLEGAPAASTRDWLRALGHSGTAVTWSGDVASLAMSVEPVADPRGAVRVSVAAPDSSAVAVSDVVGGIDTATTVGGGATVRAASAVGTVSARVAGTTATAQSDERRAIRSVVILARAGWEAKFVAAALEEHGWPVAVRLGVAPGLSVGVVPALDTARVSAVIALDSSAAASAAAIGAYVRSGGGLVLAGDAAGAPALSVLAPGQTAAPMRAPASFAEVIAPVTRLALAHAPLVRLRDDAVVLEARRDTVLVAARRLDAGRVAQSGYDETWRWRMAGGEDSPDAHRAWWAGLVEAVAYSPLIQEPGSVDRPAESAPRAALVAALGAASAPPGAGDSGVPFDPSRSIAVYIAAALLLLAEWGSRRLRGMR